MGFIFGLLLILIAGYVIGYVQANINLKKTIKLHEDALTWAVGTDRLPPTCPGHFMQLLISAKERVFQLNEGKTWR